MKLARFLSKYFTLEQKERGQSTLSDAEIILGPFDGTKCHVTIYDEPSQTLMIRRLVNSRAVVHCSCREYALKSTCGHVWATILEIDRADRKDLFDVLSEAHGESPRPDWKNVIQGMQKKQEHELFLQPPAPLMNKALGYELVYVISVGTPPSYGQTGLAVRLHSRTQNQDKSWAAPKPLVVGRKTLDAISDPLDKQVVQFLLGAQAALYSSTVIADGKIELERNWPPELISQLAQSGRLWWTAAQRFSEKNGAAIKQADFTRAFEICVHLKEDDADEGLATLDAFIEAKGIVAAGNAPDSSQTRRIANEEIVELARDGVLLTTSGLYLLSNPDARPVWESCQENPGTQIPKAERERFLERLSSLAGIENVQLPDSWEVKDPIQIQPSGELRLSKNEYQKNFYGEVFIRYDDMRYHYSDRRLNAFDADGNRWLKRNSAEENVLIETIEELPIAFEKGDSLVSWDLKFAETSLLEVLDYLAQRGWDVLLEGHGIRSPGQVHIEVESGKDWFDVSAEVKFEGQAIALPEILSAIKAKEHFIKLADGSRGRLPDNLVRQYAQLAGLGKQSDGKLRFAPNQAILLDALLEQQKNVIFDTEFKKTKKKLAAFDGVKPKAPPRSFKGTLRDYQKEGLGWLHFLRDYSLGGCLADDMGLGKTIQVLALLESRRTRKASPDEAAVVLPMVEEVAEEAHAAAPKFAPDEVSAALASTKGNLQRTKAVVEAAARCKRRPSIVVVPNSLVFNWIDEAGKFTPKLKFFKYTGTDRKRRIKKSGGFDVLITTYGTLRKDIFELANIHFDYVILDESQAIKNATAQVAKASQSLISDHRLAMTGTPIENHLGELWSLFEFLNPGMLGASSKFQKLTRISKSSDKERDYVIGTLKKSLRPFVLRRTKEQVLKDLPAKTEQTLFCEMTPAQQAKYDETKRFYQVKLKKKVDTEGLGKAKIHVLEALLRLRQIACDPRLLDKDQKSGAKLTLLQQQVEEVVAEGHKVLVFSQFTSLLALVRKQFDDASIRYEYLDGKTANRQEPVKAFQENDSVSAFLISLKAGGHGLNLTAADYVFLLDPWWNPAVEAQAIDRAHRMGQQKPVIAYRVICRGTVEEKILELQHSKRALADSIIQADESLLRTLTGDDIRMLLD